MLFDAVPILVAVIGALVVGFIIVGIVHALIRWSRNNAAPVETLRAVVITKRTNVHGGSGDSSSSTSYFATFELPTAERLELAMSGEHYGQLAEGDHGMLTRQGTRYQGFARDITGRAL
ncbi:MAG: DUF2500 domain-containing protein [Kineosporiaceae bacterium]|nr:DUF2500 domain-containing protein [Kineosporiaceae bacterium]MBK7625093.1 DUF2500 domain-containing protein [Kineosporiaceae bacterium]MBK8076531.1 DUF2500 domain-containing protein [Kineosporiaceae bacterium]